MSSSNYVDLQGLSTLLLSEGGAEISAYHSSARLIFVIGGSNKLSVVDLSNPSSPILKELLTLSGPANLSLIHI